MVETNITDWIGRRRQDSDVLRATTVEALSAAIGSTQTAIASASLLAHWLCFQQIVPRAELGADGHPRRGGFLPPVTLPRRMWAAGQLEWLRPLPAGTPLDRTSRIIDVRQKNGRSGELVFVTVEHEISDTDGLVLRERQDIVYRGASREAGAAPQPGMNAPDWSDDVTPDPVLLFRYSALTGNTHRIHYDRDYATRVEGYPALVVHGPLIATLLLDRFTTRHPGARVAAFHFRAVRPLFDTAPFTLRGTSPAKGGTATVQAVDVGGALCMDAAITLA